MWFMLCPIRYNFPANRRKLLQLQRSGDITGAGEMASGAGEQGRAGFDEIGEGGDQVVAFCGPDR